MQNESFSCIKQVDKTITIALPSAFISNEIAGVSEILERWKRQYVKQLKGVVVSYRNIFLTSRAGIILIDKPGVHYDVKATFDLFCPNIGSIVKGRINRISAEHVGCLIHDTINATINLSDYDDYAKFIFLENTILFQITHFTFQRKEIQVKGKITAECIRLMEELYPVSVPDDSLETSGYIPDSDFSPTSMPSKTKKTKRKKTGRQSPISDSAISSQSDSRIFELNISPIKNEVQTEVASIAKKKSGISKNKTKKRKYESLSPDTNTPASSDLIFSAFNVNSIKTEISSAVSPIKKKTKLGEISASLLSATESSQQSISETSELLGPPKKKRKKEKKNKSESTKRKSKNLDMPSSATKNVGVEGGLLSPPFEFNVNCVKTEPNSGISKLTKKKTSAGEACASLLSATDSSQLSMSEFSEILGPPKKKRKHEKKNKPVSTKSKNLDLSPATKSADVKCNLETKSESSLLQSNNPISPIFSEFLDPSGPVVKNEISSTIESSQSEIQAYDDVSKRKKKKKHDGKIDSKSNKKKSKHHSHLKSPKKKEKLSSSEKSLKSDKKKKRKHKHSKEKKSSDLKSKKLKTKSKEIKKDSKDKSKKRSSPKKLKTKKVDI